MKGYISSILEEVCRIEIETGRKPKFLILGEVQFLHLREEIRHKYHTCDAIFDDWHLNTCVSSLKVCGLTIVQSMKNSQYQYGF